MRTDAQIKFLYYPLCIITDSKSLLRHDERVNHPLKWDKCVVEGAKYNNEDTPKGWEILLYQNKLHIYFQLG